MFCDKCQNFWKDAISKAHVPPTITSAQDVHWGSHEVVLHQNVRELKETSNSGCIVCRCVLSIPNAYERDLISDEDQRINILLHLLAEDGRNPRLHATYQRINEDGGEAAIVIPRRLVAFFSGLLTDKEYSETLQRCLDLENSSTGSNASFELGSFWMNRCISTHDICRVSEPSKGSSFIPTRVLDVSNNHIRLIETANALGRDADRRFVALSHCWGKIPIIRTLNANYEDHLKGIHPSSLSQTFSRRYTCNSEARVPVYLDRFLVHKTRRQCRLGSRSCNHVRRISLCYSYHAAAHAPGGDVGCFVERDGLAQLPFIVEIPVTGDTVTSSPGSVKLEFTSVGGIGHLGGPEPPLYGRAWVLQEQLLSPRMLIFDGKQVKWQCLSMHGSERTPLGGASRHIGHHDIIRKGVMQDREFFDDEDTDDHESAERWKHQSWCRTVMDYTHRGMTQPSDRLVALAGIAQALSQKTKHTYIAGIWKDLLWRGLLWSISHYPDEYTTTTMYAFDVKENPHVRHKEPLAPSWSWASVTVPVVYPDPTLVFVHRISDVLSASTSGTPAKQTGKVELRGHVRTGYVNSIYQYSLQEALDTYPHMTFNAHRPDTDNEKYFQYRDRGISPMDFFIFSDTKPTSSGLNKMKLVRGTWRPDQVLDPKTEITFIALAQDNIGTLPGKISHLRRETDPLVVYTIGLVPTGVEGEYTRVGYAVWEDCAWYGYMCGHNSETRPGRTLVKPKGWRGLISSRDIEYYTGPGLKGSHEHTFSPGRLPDIRKYHKGTGVQERVVTVV